MIRFSPCVNTPLCSSQLHFSNFCDSVGVMDLEVPWILWPGELISLRDVLIVVKSLQMGCFKASDLLISVETCWLPWEVESHLLFMRKELTCRNGYRCSYSSIGCCFCPLGETGLGHSALVILQEQLLDLGVAGEWNLTCQYAPNTHLQVFLVVWIILQLPAFTLKKAYL